MINSRVELHLDEKKRVTRPYVVIIILYCKEIKKREKGKMGIKSR